jgi:hypothetical protein
MTKHTYDTRRDDDGTYTAILRDEDQDIVLETSEHPSRNAAIEALRDLCKTLQISLDDKPG